jgi:hypothetical protein
MVAWIVACEVMNKFGGDTVEELTSAAFDYRAHVARRLEQ